MKNLRSKPWLFATGLGSVFLGQRRSEGQTVVDGEDDKHDQTDGNSRMHDEHQPMPRRRVRPFGVARRAPIVRHSMGFISL